MATKEFKASWVDVYNKSGGWSKKHSNHPINAGYSSEWHSFIRIPDAVRQALNDSSTATTLEMRIYVTNSPSEIDVGYANHSSSRGTGSSGLPSYSYTETWRSFGSGWQTYGMSNFFRPRVADGSIKNIVLYSYQGAHSFQATGIGQSNYVRFRVTGTWEPPKTRSSISAGSATMGNNLGISINRSNSSLTHTVTYSFGSASGTIATKTSSTSLSWGTSLSLANQVTTSTSRSGTLTCITYDGNSEIGRTTDNFTLSVPNNSSTRPSLSGYSASISGSGYDKTIGKYVQGVTRPSVSFSANAKYGASIKSYRIRMEGRNYSTNSTTLNTINGDGTTSIEISATDSRGFTTTSTSSVYVESYSSPGITSFTASRTGTNVVTGYRGGTFSSLGGSNTLEVRVYKNIMGNTTRTLVDSVSTTTESFGADYSSSSISEAVSWEFTIEIRDSFGKVASAQVSVGTGFKAFTIHPKYGVGIGKVWERGTLDVDGDVFSNGKLYAYGGLEIAGDTWAGDESEGFSGINMNNSDIIGMNSIYFNDVAQDNNGEGLMFLKSGRVIGSTDNNDYDTVIARDGSLRFNTRTVIGDDTGWMNISLKNGAQEYSSGNTPQCRKIRLADTDLIMMKGAFRNITSNDTIVGTMPFTFASDFAFIQLSSAAGSGNTFIRWGIRSNGNLEYERKSNGDNNPNHWCPIHCTMMV